MATNGRSLPLTNRPRHLESQVSDLTRRVDGLLRAQRSMSVRDPVAGDPLVPFRVVSYLEPQAPGMFLSADCVETDGQGDGVQQTAVLMHVRVPVGETIFAARTRPYLDAGGAGGSGGSGSNDDPATYRWVQIPFQPGALIGETVCNGPNGEDDFNDNRQWVQVKKISASCSPSTDWSLSDAPPILDPCTAASGTPVEIPHIVAAFNVGNAISLAHEQPGKLVLLTPLEVLDAPHAIRWACEFIDPTDNQQACADSSSSSGETRCWAKWSIDVDCDTKAKYWVSAPTDIVCGDASLHDRGVWFCDGEGEGTRKRLSCWMDYPEFACDDFQQCYQRFSGMSEDAIFQNRPVPPTDAKIDECCGNNYACTQRYESTYSCDSKSWSAPSAVGTVGCAKISTIPTGWLPTVGDPCVYYLDVPSVETFASEDGCSLCSGSGSGSPTFTAPTAPNFSPPDGTCCSGSSSGSNSGDELYTCFTTWNAAYNCETKQWTVTQSDTGCDRMGNLRLLWTKTGENAWTIDVPFGSPFESEAGCSGCTGSSAQPSPPGVDPDCPSSSSSNGGSGSGSGSGPDELLVCIYTYEIKANCSGYGVVQSVTLIDKRCGKSSEVDQGKWSCTGVAGGVVTMRYIKLGFTCGEGGTEGLICSSPSSNEYPSFPTDDEIAACCGASSGSGGSGGSGGGSGAGCPDGFVCVPEPPSTGTYVLRAVDGVMGWVEVVERTCA